MRIKFNCREERGRRREIDGDDNEDEFEEDASSNYK